VLQIWELKIYGDVFPRRSKFKTLYILLSNKRGQKEN